MKIFKELSEERFGAKSVLFVTAWLLIKQPVQAVQIQLNRIPSGSAFPGGNDLKNATDPPTSSDAAGGGNLDDIIAVAAEWWEMHLPGNEVLKINYGWSDQFQGVAFADTNYAGTGEENIRFRVSPGNGLPWYLDNTPGDYYAYTGLLNTYADEGGGSINIGREFNAPTTAAAVNSYDILSVALHEIGHALGFSSNFGGQINIVAPLPYAGSSLKTDPGYPGDETPNMPTAHLDRNEFPNAVMIPSRFPSTRVVPSDADVLAVAQAGNHQVDLSPDFHWHGISGLGDGSITDLGPTTNHWDRNLVPGPASDVFFDQVGTFVPYTVGVDADVSVASVSVNNANQVQFSFDPGKKLRSLGGLYVQNGAILVPNSTISDHGNGGNIEIGWNADSEVTGRVLILGGGTLQVGSINVKSPLILDNGGILDVGSSASFGPIFIGSGGGRIKTRNPGTTISFDAKISGPGGLTKDGSLTSTLSLGNVANDYAGVNVIASGSLQGTVIKDEGSNSSFGQGNFEIWDGATLYCHCGRLAQSNRTIRLTGGNGWIKADPNDFLTLTGDITGNGGLGKSGFGRIILANPNHHNTYTGTTIVQDGNLYLGAADQIPNSSNVIVGQASFLMNNFSDSIGSITVNGHLVTGTGTLNCLGNDPTILNGNFDIGIAGTSRSQFGQLRVAGPLMLGGTLNIALESGFIPLAGNSFDILDWGSIEGQFTSISLPTIDASLRWNTVSLYTTGVVSIMLAADFNGDGRVDAADYVVWRNGLGTTYTQSDYDAWRANFGRTSSGSGDYLNASVPEPRSLVLIGLAAATLISLRRHKSLNPHSSSSALSVRRKE